MRCIFRAGSKQRRAPLLAESPALCTIKQSYLCRVLYTVRLLLGYHRPESFSGARSNAAVLQFGTQVLELRKFVHWSIAHALQSQVELAHLQLQVDVRVSFKGYVQSISACG